MKEHGICAKCKKSVGCPYADDRIKGCKKFVLEDELELTNEELLRQCNTEQLAEFLIASIKKCKSCASGIGVDEVQHCPFGECGCHFKSEVIEWLKLPHREG